MKKKISIMVFVILFATIILTNAVYAVSLNLEPIEYSEEYKYYLSLSDEEKQNVLEPSRYDVITPKTNSQALKEMQNIFKSSNLLKNALGETYRLNDYIPENLVIKNQGSTGACWAFASLASLETNLALKDYSEGMPVTLYDYSERHMNYGSRRNVFNGGQENEYGISTPLNNGGNFFLAQTYLSNGLGAVTENQMPFEDNEENINIEDLRNANVSTTLYDTIWFEDDEDIGKDELMSKMKQAISTYGGIYAGIHGAQIMSDAYNNETGAIYCDSKIMYPSDHAVAIIGWDDNYSKDNFNEASRPENNGAWIIKNSWGEEISQDLISLKQQFYDAYETELNEEGITSADQIPNEAIRAYFAQAYGESKVKIEGDNLVINIGDNGFMYISYDDANVYDELYAVQKATNTKDYDNIYQYDNLGGTHAIGMYSNDNLYFANKFQRNIENTNETLDKVSLFTMQEVTCRVYVNPNSDDLGNLQNVSIKGGLEEIVLSPGYHVIELENPVTLTGDSFAVAMGINSGEYRQTCMIESKEYDENAEINANESFMTTEDGFALNQWQDLATDVEEDIRGNVTIKAFTQNKETEIQLDKIEISKAPDKVVYVEGENFDKTGMEILATYSDLSTKTINNYEVLEGTNLYYGQNKVTISYTENEITKTVDQAITVNRANQEKEVSSIAITKLPNKTSYALNTDALDLTGGVITVTYTDGSTSEVNMQSADVTVSGFNGSIAGTQTITVTYEGVMATFEIQVLEQPRPELSNFENTSAKMNNILVYMYEKLNDTDYISGNIEVSGITERNADTNYTYYYYISGSATEENIEDWVEIQNPTFSQENESYTMKFAFSSKDLNNYNDLKDADKIYLYVREVAEAGEEQVEQSHMLEIDVDSANATFYVDDELIGNVDNVVDDNTNLENPSDNQSPDVVDDTVAGGTLPQTGIISIGIAILIIMGIGIFAYIRYKNMMK